MRVVLLQMYPVPHSVAEHTSAEVLDKNGRPESLLELGTYHGLFDAGGGKTEEDEGGGSGRLILSGHGRSALDVS
eukprot:764189-Hanusia_phi.AAC.3